MVKLSPRPDLIRPRLFCCAGVIMPGPDIEIVYRLYPMNEAPIELALSFDAGSFALRPGPVSAIPPPDWTRLGVEKCPNCPLDETVQTCPYAGAIARVLDVLGPRWSTERLYVEVFFQRRRIAQVTDMQNALRSLFGLIGPSSGCPRLAFLRPMGRMHLPFAQIDETAFRVISTHLMRVWLAGDSDIAVGLDDLKARYAALTVVNLGMAQRLRQAGDGDAALNAIAALDALAMGVEDLIDTGVEFWGAQFAEAE